MVTYPLMTFPISTWPFRSWPPRELDVQTCQGPIDLESSRGWKNLVPTRCHKHNMSPETSHVFESKKSSAPDFKHVSSTFEAKKRRNQPIWINDLWPAIPCFPVCLYKQICHPKCGFPWISPSRIPEPFPTYLDGPHLAESQAGFIHLSHRKPGPFTMVQDRR